MGLTERGMQPFALDGDMVVANGELYGFRPVKEALSEKYALRATATASFCCPLREQGLDMFKNLDANSR
jgi:asparagine synthase (glutamine-hydrolysing)